MLLRWQAPQFMVIIMGTLLLLHILHFLTNFSSLLDITRSGHFCRTNVSLYFLLACSKEHEYSMLDATKVGWPAKLVRSVLPCQLSRTNSRGVLAQTHGAHFVVGVDIDDALIQAAWRRRRAVWSTQTPRLDMSGNIEDDRRSAAQVAELGDQTTTTLRHYFPTSCEHEFGSLPIPPSSSGREKLSFPHNLSFRTADWTRSELPEDSEGYNVVIAWVVPVSFLLGLVWQYFLYGSFSISKWIHLNEGDEGLKSFFRRVYNVLKAGGSFVLEPQPWESYAKARRMDSVITISVSPSKRFWPHFVKRNWKRTQSTSSFGPQILGPFWKTWASYLCSILDPSVKEVCHWMISQECFHWRLL